MKNIKRLIAVTLMSVMAVTVVGCNMISKTSEGIKKTVVATVGKEKITKGQIDAVLPQYTAQLKAQYGENFEQNPEAKTALDQAKKQALDDMVTETVLLQKAKELKVAPDQKKVDDAVNKQIEEFKKSYTTDGKLDEKKYKEALDQAGFTETSLKEFLSNQQIMAAVQDYLVKDITVTDDEISTYYGANIQNYTKKSGADVSHILLATKDAAGNVDFDKSLAQAKDVEAKLAKGEKFEDLAKSLSQDPGSAAQGGSLGYLEYDNQQMVKEFMEGVKPLKEGQISAPVKSQFGYHIITVKNVQTKGYVQKLESVKEDIKQQLLQNKKSKAVTDAIEKWKTELKVQKYEDKL